MKSGQLMEDYMTVRRGIIIFQEIWTWRGISLRSPFNLKNIGYYIPSFLGSNYVNKKFNVFG